MKIFQNCKNFALAGLLAASLTGCGTEREEVFAEVSKVMTVQLPKEFTQLTFRQEAYRNSMTPTLVFEGSASQILFTTKPQLWEQFSGDKVKVYVLARTRNDRYFTFTYESKLRDNDGPVLLAKPACVEAKCRKFTDMQHVTRTEAMKWFYHSAEFTPEKFKDLFGEDAPAKEEAA